jgi:hypothetical protein
MNTEEAAKKVVELTRNQARHEAVATLYAKDIVSVEARSNETGSFETRGIEGVRGKVDWWIAAMQVFSCKVSGPFVAHDRFIVR